MTQRKARLLWIPALLLLAAMLVFVNWPEEGPPPALGAKPGETLPDFTITCLDGSSFTLSEQRGRVVVINLWATWCTPCVKELPGFDRLRAEHPEEVAVLAVHTPPVTTDVGEYLSRFSYTIPFAVDEDGSLGAALNASDVLPQTVILSPKGVVTYNQVGSLDYETLLELFEAAKGS